MERPDVHAGFGAGGAGNAPSPARDETAIRFWRDSAIALGDATGVRSESPCQDWLYYSRHLALELKDEGRDGSGVRLGIGLRPSQL